MLFCAFHTDFTIHYPLILPFQCITYKNKTTTVVLKGTRHCLSTSHYSCLSSYGQAFCFVRQHGAKSMDVTFLDDFVYIFRFFRLARKIFFGCVSVYEYMRISQKKSDEARRKKINIAKSSKRIYRRMCPTKEKQNKRKEKKRIIIIRRRRRRKRNEEQKKKRRAEALRKFLRGAHRRTH